MLKGGNLDVVLIIIIIDYLIRSIGYIMLIKLHQSINTFRKSGNILLAYLYIPEWLFEKKYEWKIRKMHVKPGFYLTFLHDFRLHMKISKQN